MKIAVTGAGGHVGSNCVRMLLDEGHEVRALLHNDPRGVENLPVERMEIAVEDRDSLVKAFKGVEVVFHLVGYISLSGKRDKSTLQKVNVDGTKNVVEACLENGVRRLIHFSSIHALSAFPVDEVVDETREPSIGDEHLEYDNSKAMGQKVALEATEKGLEVVVVNPTSILGPNDFGPSHQGRLLWDIYHHRLPALPDAGYNWVDVRDVVKGAISAMEKGRSGESYILGGEWLHLRDLVEHISKIPGARVPRIIIPLWMAYMGIPFAAIKSYFTGRAASLTTESLRIVKTHHHVSWDKAAKELGYNPRHISTTIKDTFDWFDENGWLDKDFRLQHPEPAS